MSRDPGARDASLAKARRTFSRPWPIMGVALACTVLGLAFSQTTLVPLRVTFLGAGLLVAGIAVARRLQTTSWELEDRVESAAVLAVSAIVALLTYLDIYAKWDSAELFVRVFMIVAVVGAFIVMLPRTGRRIAALAFVLFHFCGILTAVTSVPPRQDQPPWISMMIWSKFYRYYLFFTHFTNAYHFYSPDPGPATLLWFHVEYEDGNARWIKIPNREESPVGLHHQRMLAAAESAGTQPTPPLIRRELIDLYEQKAPRPYEVLPGIPHASGEEILKRRREGAETHKFVDPDDLDKNGRPRPAPLYLIFEETGAPMMTLMTQYSEPIEYGRRLMASYARHIAHTESDPSNPVKAVRVYRLVHKMMTPRELDEGKDPLDPASFLPYYQGKYSPEGKLLDPDDPFLFWHVPIVRVSRRYPEPGTYVGPPDSPIPMMSLSGFQATPEDPGKLLNFVEIHAEQSDKFRTETTKK
ncbi:MAG TPA: hypothetical protein VH592_16070 [Gemmataceae bacterium]|jgi:hypothetical protein